MSNRGNIEKFHNRTKFNYFSLIFIAIFLYLIVMLVSSIRTDKIVGYQVKKGTLSENRIYTGIAIRDEHSVTSDYTGYVSYFINEGERTAYNNLVYCIDETGKLSDLLGKDPTDDNALSSYELNSIRLDLQLFSKNFDKTAFSSVNSIDNKIHNQLIQIQNRKIIENISDINNSHTNDIIDYVRAAKPGIVLYYQDGYEDYLPSDITKEDFDMDKYESHVVLNDDLLKSGDFVYKYVFDENWSLVFFVPNSEISRISDMSYVEVKFSKDLTTSWGALKVLKSYDDESLVEISFTNSMVSYARDRFVEIELLLEEDNGLKIPNSSIAEKAFFLVNKDYVVKEDSAYKVLRREPGADGNPIFKKVEINVYKETDDHYYVEETVLRRGDVLHKFDSAVKGTESEYVVGAEGTLPGVYNINKGYADFKRIEVKYDNDEYTIVDANASYGLRAYDYIALDAKLVNDKDFIY